MYWKTKQLEFSADAVTVIESFTVTLMDRLIKGTYRLATLYLVGADEIAPAETTFGTGNQVGTVFLMSICNFKILYWTWICFFLISTQVESYQCSPSFFGALLPARFFPKVEGKRQRILRILKSLSARLWVCVFFTSNKTSIVGLQDKGLNELLRSCYFIMSIHVR